jgi:hypothetical protein
LSLWINCFVVHSFIMLKSAFYSKLMHR